MANWKKVIVSGSIANLAGIQVDDLPLGEVVIGGGSGSLASTTPVNGTGNILATTGADGVSMTGSFTGSFTGDGSGLTGVVATNGFSLTHGSGITSFTYNGSSAQTVQVSGSNSLTANTITKWTGDAFSNTSLSDNGTIVSGVSSIQLSGANSSLTGSFTGSFTGDGSGLTGIPTTLNVSGSTGNGSVNLLTQTFSIVGTSNEVETSMSGQTLTIGLPNDVTIGNTLTVTGDLTVNGTATFINSDNLTVKDKFILINSGSTTLADSGIISQYNSAGSGSAFYLESTSTGTYGRWAVAYDVVGANTSAVADEFVVTAKVGQASAPTGDPTWGGNGTNGQGNMYITSAGDIYIWA